MDFHRLEVAFLMTWIKNGQDLMSIQEDFNFVSRDLEQVVHKFYIFESSVLPAFHAV